MPKSGGTPDACDTSFPKTRRLRKRSEYLRVQKSGKRVHTRHFVMVLSPQDAAASNRIGITVTRKVANAVGRNHVKRIIREVFRRNSNLFPSGYDVVVIAKNGAPSLGYESMREEFRKANRAVNKVVEAMSKGRMQPGRK